MVEKTADKATAPGTKISQPNPPPEERQASSGFDPVDGAGQRDGQKGRPEAGATPEDGLKGKPFREHPDLDKRT